MRVLLVMVIVVATLAPGMALAQDETGVCSPADIATRADDAVQAYTRNRAGASSTNDAMTHLSRLQGALEDVMEFCENRKLPGAALFNILVNDAMNLRACPGTDCEKVGSVTAGALLPVYQTEEDWYRVQVNGQDAWLAGWLTTRGPDVLIKTGESHTDSGTGCLVVVDFSRGDRDMDIIISGERQDDVTVDFYRPGESQPLRVERQLDKTFIDTGELYIHQYYNWQVGWPNGLYRIELELDRRTTMLGWQMEQRGEHKIFVHCS